MCQSKIPCRPQDGDGSQGSAGRSGVETRAPSISWLPSLGAAPSALHPRGSSLPLPFWAGPGRQPRALLPHLSGFQRGWGMWAFSLVTCYKPRVLRVAPFAPSAPLLPPDTVPPPTTSSTTCASPPYPLTFTTTVSWAAASWTCPPRNWAFPPTASSISRPGCQAAAALAR